MKLTSDLLGGMAGLQQQVLRALDGEQPRRDGWRPEACQFIEGDPAPDDSVKCGRPVQPGSSFCAEHHARCWIGAAALGGPAGKRAARSTEA